MRYDGSVSGFGIRYTDGYKGLLTGKVTAQLTGTGISGYLYSAFYYDDRGRIIQSRSTNHLGGLEMEYFAYNLIGDVLKRNTSTRKTQFRKRSFILTITITPVA